MQFSTRWTKRDVSPAGLWETQCASETASCGPTGEELSTGQQLHSSTGPHPGNRPPPRAHPHRAQASSHHPFTQQVSAAWQQIPRSAVAFSCLLEWWITCPSRKMFCLSLIRDWSYRAWTTFGTWCTRGGRRGEEGRGGGEVKCFLFSCELDPRWLFFH